jgi:hypothetical protein
MMRIAEGWNWYVAEFVIEYRVVSHPEQLVRLVAQIEVHLLYATSREQAYDKAVALGERISDSYHNANGDLISVTCKGMHDLDNLQVETLEDEQHLTSFRLNDVTSAQMDALIPPREHLAVFETDFVSRPNNQPDLDSA